MRLWTMQPAGVLDILKKDGVFHCDQDKSIYGEDYKAPYAWMVDQMNRKGITRPEGCSLPVWAWYRHNWKEKKPDLRRIGLGEPGARTVCIEIEIPDEEVLLSDFDIWHYVLNDMWFDRSRNEAEFDERHEWFDRLAPEEQKALKKQSWENIFDIEPYEDDWVTKGRYVQAVFWELRREQVKKVQYFTAR